MPFDAFPVRPWHFRESGEGNVAFLLRDGQDNFVSAAQLTGTWDLRVYDEQAQSPETPIYTNIGRLLTAKNPDGTTLIIAATAVLTDGWSPTPQGYTFNEWSNPSVLYGALGGKTYTHEYTFTLGSSGGPIVVRIPVVIDSAYG